MSPPTPGPLDDSRRTLLLFTFAVSRGILSAEEAATALASLRGSSAAPLRSGASLPHEALGPWWSGLEGATREALLGEVELLRADEGRAELAVLTSPIPDAEKRAWWGADASRIAAGDVVVDIDFSAGVTFREGAGPEQRHLTLPSLSPEDRYQIQREVARGGMGRILLAKDVTLGRNVAVKEILSGGAEEAAASDDIERFLREARITGQLEHPNIVPVHELGQRADGRIYYTMKLVRGETMEKRLAGVQRDERLSDGEKLARRLKLLDAFVDVCQALAYAHTRGVVNRDLKPSNVMLGDFGETVVLDWGLARVAGSEDRARQDIERLTLTLNPSGDGAGSSKLTMDGAIMGTPSYMSPEQARGEIESVDEKSDIYSLGAILYEIVTGVPPFTGGSAMDVVRAVGTREPPAVSAVEPLAPRELEALIRRAMAKDRTARLGSAKLLAEEVLAFRDGRALSTFTYTGFQQVARWVRRHRGLTSGIAAAVVALVAGTVASAYYARNAAQESRNARSAEQLATVAAEKATARAREAEDAARRAEGLRLAAKARVQLAKNPGQALWLALRGVELEQTSETNSALLDALSRISERRRLHGSEGYLATAAFSPDGRLIAAGGDDRAVRFWDAGSGRPEGRLDGHTGSILRIAFSPDGSRIVSMSEDRTVRIWEVAGKRLLATLRDCGPGPEAAWAPDGRSLLTWGKEAEPRSWTGEGGTRASLGDAGAEGADISPDGRRAVLAGGDRVEVRDMATGALECGFVHGAAVADVRWRPDGREVVAAGTDGFLAAWDVSTGELRLRREVVPGASLHDLLVSTDGTRVAVRAGRQVHLLSLADGARAWSSEFHGSLESFSVSPDWTRMLRRTAGPDFSEIDLSTGEVLQRYSGHSYGVSSAAYSGDGRRIVSASNDMTAAVWDTEPGAELPLLPAPRDGGTVVDLDAARGLLLVVPPAGGVAIADAATGITVRTLRGPRPGGAPPLFLPDGHVLLHVADPPELVIIDGASGRDLGRLDVLPARLTSVLPGPAGILGRFRTEGVETLRAWSLAGDVLGTIDLPAHVHRFALSDDGALILTANSGAQTASVFDVRTGRLLHVLQGHTGYVLGAAFAGPGRCLTTGVDATGRCWDTDTGRLVAVLHWPRVEGLRISASRDGRLAWIFGGREARLYESATGRRISQVDTSTEIERAVWAVDGTFAVFFARDGLAHRRVPTNPLEAGRRAVPRDLAPFELNELEVGTTAEREELIRAWVESHPSATALTRKALLLFREQRFEEAIPLLRQALEIYPRQRDALLFIAVAENERAKAQGEGSASRARCVEEGLAALRLAIAYGLDPADIEKNGFDLLRTDPGWGETLGAGPGR